MALMKLCKFCGHKYKFAGECECGGKQNAKKMTNRNYDKNVRKSSDGEIYYNFYHSLAWQKCRVDIIKKYFGICLGCWEEGFSNQSETLIVHHIENLKSNWNLRLDKDNLIPLCRYHHESDKHDNVEYWKLLKNKFEKWYNRQY